MGYRKTGVGGFIFAAAVATVLFVTASATPLPTRADSKPSTTVVADATLVAVAGWFDAVDPATGISMHHAEAERPEQFADDLTVLLQSVTRGQQKI